MKQSILAVSLLLSSFRCDDHPWPTPVAVFDITDISNTNAPITCTGTAHAYVDPQSDGTVASWVEGDGLVVKNVSNKIITKMLIEARWQDVRGEGTSVINYNLDFTDPADSIQPGGSWSIHIKHKPGPKIRKSKVEFDSLPEVTPKLRAHALLITFSDGTTYSEAPDLKERPW